MSTPSESTHRPGHTQPTEQPEVRKNSRYEIYKSTTKPFGEGYRRSVLLHSQDYEQDDERGHERQDSLADTDSVGDRSTMGCSESRTEVAVTDETVKGRFVKKGAKAAEPKADEELNRTSIQNDVTIVNNVDNEPQGDKTKTDMGTENHDHDTIYNTEIRNINDSDQNTLAIYSEVKKETKKIIQNNNQTPREQLMQQIRERKLDTEKSTEKIPFVSKALKKEHINGDEFSKGKDEKEEENTAICVKTKSDKLINTIVSSAPVSFVEEEYTYEPDKKEASSKLVMRSRSLLNLDQNQYNYNSSMTCNLKRPNALKMTTKPDGTIRYGLRHGSSESDLLDSDLDAQLIQTNEIKTNYVNSIKNAFDAAVENQNRHNVKRAEAFDGLKQYFQDNKRGLQELLINNNVVIIEPFRPDQSRNASEKSDIGSPRTCRITGATIKSPVNEQRHCLPSSNTLPRRHTKSLQTNRQGFYHPIKVNKELIDAELPDPDKVRTARELFQKVAKSNSTSALPVLKFGCKSLSNNTESKMRITPEVKVIQGGKQINDKRKGLEQGLREDVKRYPAQRRWTDSGSLSSGVSSDFSCDQDWDLHHYHESSHSGSNPDILEEYNTDDEIEYIYHYDDIERHPVSLEVMQKIRACGTTVTYYGGKIIARSHGQLRSPMTMSIMDEIRQNAGSSEGRKKMVPEEEEPYLGVKFRLVKSNSCGSRLEIAGTEEEHSKLISPCHESYRGKSIAEEVTETKEEEDVKETPERITETTKTTDDSAEEENQTLSNEEEEDKVEADRYGEVTSQKNPQVMTWAELKLKEARKQWHCAPEAVRLPAQDMEFETFEVLDESSAHKTEMTETGRG